MSTACVVVIIARIAFLGIQSVTYALEDSMVNLPLAGAGGGASYASRDDLVRQRPPGSFVPFSRLDHLGLELLGHVSGVARSACHEAL